MTLFRKGMVDDETEQIIKEIERLKIKNASVTSYLSGAIDVNVLDKDKSKINSFLIVKGFTEQ